MPGLPETLSWSWKLFDVAVVTVAVFGVTWVMVLAVTVRVKVQAPGVSP